MGESHVWELASSATLLAIIQFHFPQRPPQMTFKRGQHCAHLVLTVMLRVATENIADIQQFLYADLNVIEAIRLFRQLFRWNINQKLPKTVFQFSPSGFRKIKLRLQTVLDPPQVLPPLSSLPVFYIGSLFLIIPGKGVGEAVLSKQSHMIYPRFA